MFEKGYTPWNKGISVRNSGSFRKGGKPWNFGKPAPWTVAFNKSRIGMPSGKKGKIYIERINLNCWSCGKKIIRKKTSIRKYNFCGNECVLKWRKTQGFKREQSERTKGKTRFEKNGMWKGGISDLARRIRTSFEYRQWRTSVFSRDNYTCSICKKRGGYLHVHHLKPFKIIISEFLKKYSQFSLVEDKDILFRLSISYQEFWNVPNGIILCKNCHLIEEKSKRAHTLPN